MHILLLHIQLALRTCLACLLLTVAVPSAFALPFVSPIFGDHMVLQRGQPNTIWGWAEPGQEVNVTIAESSSSTTAASDGRWSVQIDPPPAGGPYKLTIDGPRNVEFNDILVGDVWLCSGQSNMEWGMARVLDAANEIAAANHPNLRLRTVNTRAAYSPSSLAEGSWEVCTPETVAANGSNGFSAVGFYFGRKLQQDLDVPIGLIQVAVGGSPAESWASEEALRPLGDFNFQLDEIARLSATDAPEYGNFISHWYDEYDPGHQNNAWFAAGLDDKDWTPVALPGNFHDLGVGETPAVVYFRKSVTLPDPLPRGEARIQLGVVERMDTTFINGQWVGASAWVENPRSYRIANGILKPGANIITVRVFKTAPDGGFRSEPEALKLVLGDNTEISLAGEWKGKVSVDARPPHPMPAGFENWPTMPSVLYNGMIAPVAPLAISGAIWYQGEANVGRDEQYRALLPAMIADWREAFGQGDFPFYIVSLAAFMQRQETPPARDAWAELRDAQAHVAGHVPNSGLAITIDKGDANDIHPIDKRPVGERLALSALANHYGLEIPYSGPTFKSMEVLPGELRLRFDHIEGGLKVNGDKLEEFAIRGERGQWTWADARIEGDTVIVSSPAVSNPNAVRYAWQANPKATLVNGAGLPAVPFRTDAP